ncbi:MAG: hypothetical protein IKT76_06340, partial [Bacteroides sp.]|nr:hypothetical protein [Bacteroides sp.]
EAFVGSIVGEINESIATVSSCYWNSEDSVIGGGSATTTDCNGSTTDWSAAMTVMNTALSSTSWQYVENDDDVTKVTIPLLLKNN